jgi:hypothetical protein
MRRDQGEGVIGADLDVQFGETTADREAPAAEQEILIRMRTARGEGNRLRTAT